jgi:hypothetical protein
MPAVAAAPETERPRTRSRSRTTTTNNGAGELTTAQAAAALARFPFRFEIVPIHRMFVDTSYQRPLTSLASEIEEHFNPALVMTLCLSLRSNGKYAVMDGQTRMVGCEKLGLEALPSLVYEGLAKSDEAQIFELIQTARRNVSSFYRFRASVQGKNPQSLAIVKLVEDLKLGYKIGLASAGSHDEIRSVAALEYGYKLEPFALERALVAHKQAWPNLVPDGRMIRALTLYFHTNPTADDEHVVRRLGVNNPRELRIAADHLQASRTASPPGGKSKYGYLMLAIKSAVR